MFRLLVYLWVIVYTKGLIYREKYIWSNRKFNRPKWAGDIIASTSNGLITSVSGVLLPIATASKRCPKRPFVVPLPLDIKTFTSEMDKGHVIALELGGPNTKWNIVMQPSQWQRFGHWRQLEKILTRLTLRAYQIENAICADEIYMLSKPKKIVKIIYKLNYNKNRKLKNVMGRLYAGEKAINFQIKTKGKLLINNIKLYEIRKYCDER